MSKKHIYHLYENYDITFGQLFQLVEKLCSGLETTEKIDGQALSFRVDTEGKVLFARNKTQQSAGGKDIKEVISSLSPAIHDVFLSASSVLQQLANAMTLDEIAMCFPSQDYFCNFEIVSENKRNVIMYDGNNIVLHNIDNGTDTRDDCFRILLSALSRFSDPYWNVSGPSIISFDNKALGEKAIDTISSIMSEAALDESDRVSDLVHRRIFDNVLLDFDNSNFAIDIADKYTGSAGKNLRELKKQYTFIPVETIEKWGRSNKTKIRKNIAEAIHDYITCLDSFGRGLLKDVRSAFIDDNEKTIQQIRYAINMIGNDVFSGIINDTVTKKQLKHYEKNLRKLGHTSHINTAIEGTVFVFNNTLFKITGCFASYNQILGCLGFDKKDEIINHVGGKNGHSSRCNV